MLLIFRKGIWIGTDSGVAKAFRFLAIGNWRSGLVQNDLNSDY